MSYSIYPSCFICGTGKSVSLFERFGKYTIYSCVGCGLQFSEPRDYDSHSYDEAFQGDNDFSSLGYIARLSSFQTYPLYNFERFILRWLRCSVPRGSFVLDLGCGGGVMLYHLRRRGFQPLGLDVTPSSIQRLQEQGFTAAGGSIDSYPSDWPEPVAILMLEVLEHLPDPVDFIRRVATRFPRSYLIVSVPSSRRFTLWRGTREVGDYPPHHFTRWTPKALTTLFKNYGYTPRVFFPFLSPQNISGSGIGMFVFSLFRKQSGAPTTSSQKPIRLDIRLIRLKQVLFLPIAAILHLLGVRDISMVVVGTPSFLTTDND